MNSGFVTESNRKGLIIDKNSYGVKVLIETANGWERLWIAGSTSVKKLIKEKKNE